MRAIEWQRPTTFNGVPMGESVCREFPDGGSVLVSDGAPYGQRETEVMLFRADGRGVLLLSDAGSVNAGKQFVADRWEELVALAAATD